MNFRLRDLGKFMLQGILLLYFIPAQAQNATISGKVIDNSDNTGLPGASVIIDGTTQGAMTDLDGNYKIANVAPGNLKIKVSYVGYITDETKLITVFPGENKNLDFKLKENINQLSQAEVVGQRITNTENAVLMEVRKSEQIVNGVSSQQITRSQDRTATEVIRRIPGITITESGFVLIRGLNERYNTTMLNGILAPSMEADKRAFNLDVIPSSMLDRLMVYKTGAPELPGEYAGGIIRIVTKNVSDDDQLSIGYQASYRENTTFNDFYQAPRGERDWLGSDDGTRALPESFPDNLVHVKNDQELTDLGRSLPNAWTPAKIQAGPDHRFNATLNKNLKFGKIKAGNVTSIQYNLSHESNSAENNSYESYDPELQKSDTTYAYHDDVYRENVRIALTHNWSFIVSPRFRLDFRNFFNQQGSNQSIIREGISYDEGNQVRAYAFRYVERTVYSGQLQGSHELNGGKSLVDWTTAYSYTHSAEPDFRRIRMKKDVSADIDDPYQISISPSASTLDAGRFYSNINENTFTAAANLEHALRERESDLTPKLRGGFYTEYKVRDFKARWMSYKKANSIEDSAGIVFDNSLLFEPLDQVFSPDNINSTTGFKLEEGTNPSDEYDASNTLLAGYIGTSWPFSAKWNVSGGLRLEYNRQELTSRTYTDREVAVDNPITSLLPSVNVSYNLTKKSVLRGGYARSVNRPEFRELAPFSYYDFTFNNVLTGNSALETPSIHNYDLRWELYPSSGELFSIGAFYKHFNNPIEMFFTPGAGALNFTYGNAESAASAGVEIEAKKYFSSLLDTMGKDQSAFITKFLSRMGVSMNVALIESKVELGSKAVGQAESRPMMGQSPFIVNAGIFYYNMEKKFQVTVLYNIIGNRLFAVGTTDGTPDLYYMPRNMLDFTITKGIGKYLEVKAGVQDILSQDEEYIQDSNENGKIDSHDETIYRISKGAYYSLGINLRF